MIQRKHQRWLLPLVVLIWLGVGARFWEGPHAPISTEKIPPLMQQDSGRPEADWQFSISLPYRDVFLGQPGIVRTRNRQPEPLTAALASPPPIQQYLGSVQSRHQAIGLVRMQNQEIRQITEGQSLAGLTILHIQPERLVFRRAKSEYTLRLARP